MKKKIVILPGDGIGTEICEQAVKVLQKTGDLLGYTFDLEHEIAGGACIDKHGIPLQDSTLEKCKHADAVLLGAVGGPKWEGLDFSVRPERALLKLRSELQLYANLRPAIIYSELADASTLKREVLEGADILVIRELTGGIYFGKPRGVKIEDGKRVGFNTLIYNEDEIRRIARTAFEAAMKRRKKVCSVDKANVLESTELWRTVVTEEHKNYPEIELSHMYIDNAVMQVIRNPRQFDTVVTTNMFGDILSDACAMITGSIGMLPSASVGGKNGMYEPVHGSAPDIAGQNIANPLATILSVGMMFKYSFGDNNAYEMIERAVKIAISTHRTKDIMDTGKIETGILSKPRTGRPPSRKSGGSDRDRRGKKPQQSVAPKLSADDKLFLSDLHAKLTAFSSSDETRLELEPYNSYKRKLVHDLAVKFGMESASEGEGDERHNVIIKTEKVTVPNIDYSKKEIWNHGNREYMVRKTIDGVDICLNADGSVTLYSGQPAAKIIHRKKVTTGAFKVINSKIVEFNEPEWA
ncbi:hypothetical protein CHS0354_026802 [Potamilus streckersoni]|uniref:3-isopropylmalate dehydrogenase n=1 Tax=Potamilus streckersoni TaxID=2493646 RepID=A0AAE0W6K0_9BIVA|nr:hypothetical protein CHS0354_026802 [Potamilus streckersoni]